MTRFLISLLMAVLLLVPADAQIIINPGGGGGGGSGTVTSIATGCQATGGTITTSGTISTQFTLSGSSPVTSTPYTVQASDACNLLLFQSGASAITLPNPTTTGFGAGKYFMLDNASGGTLTLSTTASGGYTGIDAVTKIWYWPL